LLSWAKKKRHTNALFKKKNVCSMRKKKCVALLSWVKEEAYQCSLFFKKRPALCGKKKNACPLRRGCAQYLQLYWYCSGKASKLSTCSSGARGVALSYLSYECK
jgi:hypothetical protein